MKLDILRWNLIILHMSKWKVLPVLVYETFFKRQQNPKLSMLCERKLFFKKINRLKNSFYQEKKCLLLSEVTLS